MASDDEILSALAPLNADHTLGRYELLTPIGRGGMAVVWAARLQGSRGFSKMVAIKVMLPHLSIDPRFERMFLREAKIASRIRHPNVCEIADLGEQDGLLYLVMEWVDGDSLAAVMRDGGPVPHDVAAHLAAEAGRGLHAAHQLRSDDGELLDVVHRDVSPQNILVTKDGVVRIVDFGVAKAANDGEQTTQSGFTKGKVGYVAPEQVNGAAVDARTDVFALGVVLYELATRVHPFRGPTDLATLLAVASTDELEDPLAVDPTMPPALAAIVRKAIEKDPDARYATMAEAVAALDAFVEGQPEPLEIQARTRDFVANALAESITRRAQRLREAETAFAERRHRRARVDTTAGGARGSRGRVVAGSIAVGALVVGAALGMRLARPTPSTEAAPSAPAAAAIPITSAVADTVASASASTALATASAALTPSNAPSQVPVKRTTPLPSARSTALPTSPLVAPPVTSPSPPASSGPRFREPGF